MTSAGSTPTARHLIRSQRSGCIVGFTVPAPLQSAAVEAALDANPVLLARHIDVSVDRGKVSLGGYVWSNEDLYRAPLIVRSVPVQPGDRHTVSAA